MNIQNLNILAIIQVAGSILLTISLVWRTRTIAYVGITLFAISFGFYPVSHESWFFNVRLGLGIGDAEAVVLRWIFASLAMVFGLLGLFPPKTIHESKSKA